MLDLLKREEKLPRIQSSPLFLVSLLLLFGVWLSLMLVLRIFLGHLARRQKDVWDL